MPTFGNCTEQPSWGYSSEWGGYKGAMKFTLSEAGYVSKLSAYLGGGYTAGTQYIKGIIYADNAGSPGDLIAVTPEESFGSSEPTQWYEFIFSSLVYLPAGDYWLGLHWGGDNTMGWNLVGAGVVKYNADTYADGPTDPFGSTSDTVYMYTICATYTTDPGLSIPAAMHHYRSMRG